MSLRARRAAVPRPRGLLPLVALASVATVPFMTEELWGYIPSYARYGAPAAGMLVLLYAISRDRRARNLMVALMVLTLTNPEVALFPMPPASVQCHPAEMSGGRRRCSGRVDARVRGYHDEEWGRPVADDRGIY